MLIKAVGLENIQGGMFRWEKRRGLGNMMSNSNTEGRQALLRGEAT